MTEAGCLVMVAEDNRDFREMLTGLLEDEGYRVIAAENGRRALDALMSGAVPCIILLDLMMPVMDGWQFLREQRNHPSLASIPVVAMTAAGEGADAGPVARLIHKPIDIESLLAAVRTYC